MPVTVQGGAELNRLLSELPVRVQKNVLRQAVRAGANVIRDDARARAPRKKGRLVRAIGTWMRQIRSDGAVTAAIGVRRDAFYARFIEFGRAAFQLVVKRKKVLSAGPQGPIFGRKVSMPSMAPRPFLRPALDAKAQGAVETMASTMRTRLEAEVRALRGAGG